MKRRRPFLVPVWLTAIAALALFGVAVAAMLVWFTANSTTVIVIRHAEKEAVEPDPALSEAGQARAMLLVRMFGAVQGTGRVDAIYTSPALRNRQTAAPLAARLGLTPIVAAADDPKALARRALRDNSGKRVMIVGHSNTVAELVSALSGLDDIPKIDEHDFSTMYIVTVPRIGSANVLRLSY
jgi:2,3-bisphosphoglycerate-dependent phosphoglycerate mutase